MSKEWSRLISTMKSVLTRSSDSVIIGLSGWSGALLVGMILFGPLIVNWRSPAFQYLVFGAATSVLFVACKERGFWESTTYALAFALYCAIPTRDLFPDVFLDAALFFLFACVCFHFIWKLAEHRVMFGKFLILGLAFALFEVARTAAFSLVHSQSEFLQSSLINAALRGTLGVGVGAGIELAQFILRSFVHRQQ